MLIQKFKKWPFEIDVTRLYQELSFLWYVSKNIKNCQQQ
jgi:hypothetical protein